MYLLEHAFDLKNFFEERGPIKNMELATKPYSFFRKLNMIEE